MGDNRGNANGARQQLEINAEAFPFIHLLETIASQNHQLQPSLANAPITTVPTNVHPKMHAQAQTLGLLQEVLSLQRQSNQAQHPSTNGAPPKGTNCSLALYPPAPPHATALPWTATPNPVSYSASMHPFENQMRQGQGSLPAVPLEAALLVASHQAIPHAPYALSAQLAPPLGQPSVPMFSAAGAASAHTQQRQSILPMAPLALPLASVPLPPQAVQPQVSVSLEAKKRRVYRHDAFPVKLYKILVECETSGRADIASFSECGTTFRIHEPRRLAEEILPKYFRHNNFTSFRRLLNMYGFIKKPGPIPRFNYLSHPLFLRGHPQLCHHIKRTSELEVVVTRR